MFDRWCGICVIMSCFSLSPYFCGQALCFLLCSNLMSLLLSVTSGFHLAVNPLFPFMKLSFDCRPWQRHAYLLDSVLESSMCCEVVLLNPGKISSIINFSCLLWSFKAFDVAELARWFIHYFTEWPHCWFDHLLKFFSISFLGLFFFIFFPD